VRKKELPERIIGKFRSIIDSSLMTDLIRDSVSLQTEGGNVSFILSCGVLKVNTFKFE